ncbi:hypothetical protein RUND412_003477 [Rhizina undulata]
MSTRKKQAPTIQASPQGKRKRYDEEEDSDVSDSELSELNEEDITAFEREEEDEDDDDEEEEDEDEEDYEFEDEKDLSEEEMSSRKGPSTSTSKAAAKPPLKSTTDTAKSSAADKAPTIRLTLKMGKEKLREATSTWTPPPGVAGTSSGAPTPKDPVRPARGRKVVAEESSSEEDDDDDEEEEEDVEGEVEMEVEAEGEDDDLVDEDAEGETDDELLDSDEEMAGADPFRSRTGTPDMSRMTKRQKGMLDDVYSADLLELPAGIERSSAAKIVPLTADEAALKRAEMARRRKNLTDQRLEEEKMDTINKLLKKQTPKMRKSGRTGDVTPALGEMDSGVVIGGGAVAGKPPNMVRWVSDARGIRVHVPESWLVGPAGDVFRKMGETETMKAARERVQAGRVGRMVEEMEE